MMINKSQGQTFNCVGVLLLQAVFSHVQLYVTLSRCTSPAALRVFPFGPVHDRTPNVVYHEA